MKPVDIHTEDFTFKLHASIKGITAEWDQLAGASVLLSSNYLKTLERFPPENMKFRYVLIYQGEALLACLYFQLLPFRASDRLQLDASVEDGFLPCFYRSIKKLVARSVDFVTLINGNLLATGPYGIKFRDAQVQADFSKPFSLLVDELFKRKDWIQQASVCLVKEWPVQNAEVLAPQLHLETLHPFCIQPAMTLALRPDWKTFEDYLGDLQSKYRLRVRKAMHAGDLLVHREFDLEELERYQEQVFNLYVNTADGSEFNLVKLHPSYFLELKKAMPDRFRMFGFFRNGTLIAFYSFLDDGKELLGHFLGTMKENNLRYQVYMNILLKFITAGIEGRFTSINLARTAIEIKSSVGAVPVDMTCFLTHRNRIINKIVPNLIEYLKPEDQFVIRSPFRKELQAPKAR